MPHDFDDEDDAYQEIRAGVRKLCAQFPGEYWRKLDREMAYPAEFVAALTKAGYLSALIPEEYGGAGLTLSAAARSSRRSSAPAATAAPAMPRCTPWARCCGTAAPRRKAHYLPGIASGELRLQAFGVTEPTSGTDTSSLQDFARREGDALRHQRPEDLDQPRRIFRPDAAAGAHHAEGAGREAHRRAVGVHRRHAGGQGQRAHHPPDPHHDEPRHHRSVLRRYAGAGGKPDRRGGQGLPLHPLRHECRAHPDRGRMHRRRQMVHRQGHRLRQGARRCSAGRSARTRASSFRSRAPMRRCAPPN